MIARSATLMLAILLGAMVAMTATAAAETQTAIVTFKTSDGSTFRVELARPADIQRVQDALRLDGKAGIPIGRLAPGSGVINVGHAWHMEDVTLADVAIEMCDGTASGIDGRLDYWLDVVGQFCPWSAIVTAIELRTATCTATINGSPVPGVNGVVLVGCEDGADAVAAIEQESGMQLRALWALHGNRWLFSIPDAPQIDGGLATIPSDPIAAVAVLG